MEEVTALSEELFRRAEKSEEEGRLQDAYKDLLAAAKLGHTWSQVNLANFYSAGKGVAADFREAEKWYRRAARSGDGSAAYNLALDLQTQGRRKSAIRWLQKAIVLKHGEAHVALAKLRRARKTKIDLLRKAVSLSPDDITDDSREEAEALLRELTDGNPELSV